MNDVKLAAFICTTIFVVLVGFGSFVWYMKNHTKYIS